MKQESEAALIESRNRAAARALEEVAIKAREEEAQRQEAQRQEAQRQEAQRQEAQRQEAQRQEAQRQEAQWQEAQRQEAQRQEAQRQAEESERRAAADQAERRLAAELESRKRATELARQQALAIENQAAAEARAASLAADRRAQSAVEKSAADGAAQRAAEKGATTPGTTAAGPRPEAGGASQTGSVGSPPGGGESRKPGESAATQPRAGAVLPPQPAASQGVDIAQSARPNVPAPNPKPPAPRRKTLLGRTDREVGVVMYAEGWRQKIELNATLDLLNGAASGSYANPLVTVALRRDGTVESVVFNRSSGSQEVDAAVRRIIILLSPYTPFPPDVAQDYDVVEIQRVWTFDKAVRLFSGGR